MMMKKKSGYSGIKKTHVSLCLYGSKLAPNRISKFLGIKADYCGLKGQKKYRKYIPYKKGFWILCTKKKLYSKNTEDHIDWLIRLLERKKFMWLNLPGVEEAGVSCFISSNYEKYERVSVNLSVKTMSRLTALNLPVWFDFYW